VRRNNECAVYERPWAAHTLHAQAHGKRAHSYDNDATSSSVQRQEATTATIDPACLNPRIPRLHTPSLPPPLPLSHNRLPAAMTIQLTAVAPLACASSMSACSSRIMHVCTAPRAGELTPSSSACKAALTEAGRVQNIR
jgi:hypothetical protein